MSNQLVNLVTDVRLITEKIDRKILKKKKMSDEIADKRENGKNNSETGTHREHKKRNRGQARSIREER
jgi:hypothetical protein